VSDENTTESEPSESKAAESEEPKETEATSSEKKSHKEVSRWEVYLPTPGPEDRHEIYIASFPSIVYFWPAILTFFLCGVAQYFELISPGTLGWFAILAFAFNILVIVQDFDQKKFLILVLFIITMGLCVWIINMKGFTFLSSITQWLIGLEPTLSTSAYLIFGITLLLLFCWGMIHPLFDYWKFEHNEFVHYIQPFGRDMSIPRIGSTVSKHVPDILEFILTLGGGALVIRREGEVVATIPHIPFLGRRMKVIEKMLSEQRVTTYDH
jgi:hypothetical protein